MRYGVIADVHGNLPALDAALAAVGRAGVDQIVFAGDLVGYGAFPNECVERVAELEPVAVAGNHDLVAIGRLSPRRCIALARETLEWTQTVLRPDTARYLEDLPLRADVDGLVVAHGSLDDPEEYTTLPEEASRQLKRLARERPATRALVLGHTHRPWAYGCDAGSIGAPSTVALGNMAPILLNPGAVGQSRAVRVRAHFIVLDTERERAEFHAVTYDVGACRDALRRAGLPERTYHLPPPRLADSLRRGRRVVRRVLPGRGQRRDRA